MVREDGAIEWLRTAETAGGWRRGWEPLTNSDLSRTGDDLRKDAEAIVIFFLFCQEVVTSNTEGSSAEAGAGAAGQARQSYLHSSSVPPCHAFLISTVFIIVIV